MLRSVSVCAMVVSAAAVFALPALAAEKAAKTSTPAAVKASAEDAREHVHQALLAETQGDNDARAQRLAKALLSDPGFPAANWQAARIQVDGEWLPLSQAVNRFASDPELTKYRELRDKATNAKSLRDLACWCKKNGQRDAARLHFSQLLAHAEADAEMKSEAVRELDLHQVGDCWLTGSELEAQNTQAKALDNALAKWRPRLKRLQATIDGDSFTRRDKAIGELNQIEDPAIIPVLESFMSEGDGRFQEEIVKRLAKFPHYPATEALVRLAVLPESVVIRDEAIKALKERPLHEFCPLLLAGLVAPLESKFEVLTLPNGAVTYRHAITREDRDKKVSALNVSVAAPHFVRPPIIRTASRTPELVRDDTMWLLQSQLAGEAANKALDVQLAASLSNQPTNDANKRIFKVLRETTGQQLPENANQWWQWWQDYNEYHWPKAAYYSYTSSYSEYYTRPPVYRTVPYSGRSGSCFLAGTPIRTETGMVPVESLRPGDRVLAQDQDTGELAFKVILKTTLRPPTKIVRITAGSDVIVTTLGHPFWVCGYGWKMAKQLNEGDLLHSLGGAVRIEKVVSQEREEQAHNLVVDGFNTYFVGQAGLLVHDNEFRKPTRAVVPGLVSN